MARVLTSIDTDSQTLVPFTSLGPTGLRHCREGFRYYQRSSSNYRRKRSHQTLSTTSI